MRSKYEIERQLAHFRGDCATRDAEKEIWIKALDWVLGDAAHRANYDQWLEAMDQALTTDTNTITERTIAHAGRTMLRRLR